MATIFTASTQEQTAQQLADSLPQGDVWKAKNISTSSMRKLIVCLASAFNLVQQLIETAVREFNINTTVAWLPNWETSCSLPDTCTNALADTIEERRNQVIERIKKTPIVTIADIQAYVDRYFPSLGVLVFASYDDYIPFGLTGQPDEFYVVVGVPTTNEFEYEFEMEFGTSVDESLLLCRLNKILPANVIPVIAYY